MNLENKKQVKNLLKPTVIVYKTMSNGSLRKVKNNFLKGIFVHKTSFGYRAIIEFDHRQFDIDSTMSSSTGTVGYSLSFVPKPYAKTEEEKGGELMIIVEFKLPKGKKFQIV